MRCFSPNQSHPFEIMKLYVFTRDERSSLESMSQKHVYFLGAMMNLGGQ